MKTLIAEDDFTSMLLMRKILSAYGECSVAVNGKEAVATFQKAVESGAPYDLVCMDIMMPEMDGFKALKTIRGIELEKGIFSSDGVKIIMTTALGDVQSVSTAYSELCDGYLIKPIDKSKLLDLLNTLHLI
jgi:two-component system, chemotaxis family, chemotaxis protein CheY